MILRPSADGDVSFRRALLLLLLLLLLVVVVAFSAGTWRRPDEAGRRRERCLLKVPLPYVSPTARHGAAAGADTGRRAHSSNSYLRPQPNPRGIARVPQAARGNAQLRPNAQPPVRLNCHPNAFRRTRSGPLAVRTSAGNVHQQHHLAPRAQQPRREERGESVRVYHEPLVDVGRRRQLSWLRSCPCPTRGFCLVPQKTRQLPTANRHRCLILSKAILLTTESSQEAPDG
jgi:hypothetical protein